MAANMMCLKRISDSKYSFRTLDSSAGITLTRLRHTRWVLHGLLICSKRNLLRRHWTQNWKMWKRTSKFKGLRSRALLQYPLTGEGKEWLVRLGIRVTVDQVGHFLQQGRWNQFLQWETRHWWSFQSSNFWIVVRMLNTGAKAVKVRSLIGLWITFATPV